MVCLSFRRAFAALVLVAVTGASVVPQPALAAGKPPVTVFAAASLREAFEAAAPAFTKRTGFAVRFSFGGSDTLATQLLQGAPADVFAAANVAQMTRVAVLVDAPRTLAHNRLVVIAGNHETSLVSVADLARRGVRVVIAASSVPVGAYSREAFAKLAKDPAYGLDFYGRVSANVVSEETDVKAVATKVALGEAHAGVVYATDVTPALAPKVRVLRFPAGVAPEATYPIAAVKNAGNADGARAFIDFITSPAGSAFLKARGFEE
jgi:molybdate transport system substrate-binding protein